MLEMKQRAEQARFKDLESYIRWYGALTAEEMRGHEKQTDCSGPNGKEIRAAATQMFDYTRWSSHDTSDQTKERYLEELRKLTDYAHRFEQPLEVAFRNEQYALLHCGNPTRTVPVWDPDTSLTITQPVDRSDLTMQDLHSLVSGEDGQGGFTSLLPADGANITMRQVQEQSQAAEAMAEQLRSEMEAVQNAATGELAELQAKIRSLQEEMESKKEVLLAELRVKQAELDEQKKQLERQIFILSSQIYAIECYLGETVNFHKLKEGRNAPDTEPIVLHQKLRFLDEELGRLASIYELDWEKADLFEDFLARSPEAIDVFAPNPRCIVLVRLSKTATTYGRDDVHPYSNYLKEYEYYHGTTCGIIIRNGENLYFGWTDKDHIKISDDLILDLHTKDVQPAEAPENEHSWDRERRLKREEQERETVLHEYLSRVFLFNILQGVVDNKSNLLPLPRGVKLSRQSEYVQFALADKWLADARFGSFNNIVSRCNAKITKGDHVLVTQNLSPEFYRPDNHSYYYNNSYDNPRGRGERNRMRDCSASDCTIYPINLVEYDKPVPMVRYTQTWKDHLGEEHTKTHTMAKVDFERLDNEDCTILEEYDKVKRHIFVSVEKEWSYNGARSNFELYENEYINLTYMNSVWLEWVVNIRTLGDWTIKGQAVSYAYAIRYIKTALDFVRKREAGERALLDAIDPNYTKCNPEWPLALSEWKLEFGVRELTEYQVKRFLKHIEKEERA